MTARRLSSFPCLSPAPPQMTVLHLLSIRTRGALLSSGIRAVLSPAFAEVPLSGTSATPQALPVRSKELGCLSRRLPTPQQRAQSANVSFTTRCPESCPPQVRQWLRATVLSPIPPLPQKTRTRIRPQPLVSVSNSLSSLEITLCPLHLRPPQVTRPRVISQTSSLSLTWTLSPHTLNAPL